MFPPHSVTGEAYSFISAGLCDYGTVQSTVSVIIVLGVTLSSTYPPYPFVQRADLLRGAKFFHLQSDLKPVQQARNRLVKHRRSRLIAFFSTWEFVRRWCLRCCYRQENGACCPREQKKIPLGFAVFKLAVKAAILPSPDLPMCLFLSNLLTLLCQLTARVSKTHTWRVKFRLQ